MPRVMLSCPAAGVAGFDANPENPELLVASLTMINERYTESAIEFGSDVVFSFVGGQEILIANFDLGIARLIRGASTVAKIKIARKLVPKTSADKFAPARAKHSAPSRIIAHLTKFARGARSIGVNLTE